MTRHRRRTIHEALLFAILCPCVAAAQSPPRPAPETTQSLPAIADASPDRVLDLPLPDGARVRVLYSTPATVKATIVMLPGGSGEIGVERDGEIRHGDNFVVRTRALWGAAGFALVIPDTVDRSNLRGLRSSPHYAGLVDRLIQFAHIQAGGPVFLLGTSQGSIAAMNAAAHARAGSLAGVVLTESVSRMGGSHETVFDADPQDVRVPALVVANRDDRCDVAPPQDAPRIAAAMRNAPDVRVLEVAGGDTESDKDCGSLTPHGYYGIESEVVGAIVRWLNAHG